MKTDHEHGLLAIDVGSSRVKLGWFTGNGDCEKPSSATPLGIASPLARVPDEVLQVAHSDPRFQGKVTDWIDSQPGIKQAGVRLASVRPEANPQIAKALGEPLNSSLRELKPSQLPIELDLVRPETVGIDRLLAALVAVRLKPTASPAIVVSVGTAITVNLISAEGVFRGGAILPGFYLLARSLHEGTASLPMVEPDFGGSPPDSVGRSTQAAIEAGVFWSAVGGACRLVEETSRSLEAEPTLFLSGGDAELLAPFLPGSRCLPDMVLSGMHIAWQEA